jgi:hypothetical protein
MAIFDAINPTVDPMNAVIPQGQGDAPVAKGLASLGSLFMSAGPTTTRAPTQNEIFGKRWSEWQQAKGLPGVTPGSAAYGQLQDFGKMFPELEAEAFAAATTAKNIDVQIADANMAVQIENDKAFLTSPEGQAAVLMSDTLKTEEEKASFIASKKAEFILVKAENDKIAREVSTTDNYVKLAGKAWNNNLPAVQAQANIFADGIIQLGLAISKDPSVSFNLDELGISAALPELAGVVATQNNIEELTILARSALSTKMRKDISVRTGIPEGDLGQAPTGWEDSVFKTFDSAATFAKNKVDPSEIEKRLKSQAFTDMASAGVPVAYISTMATLAGANPTLSAQLMAGLSGPAGKFNEELLAGRLEVANQALKESSKKDLIDARYAFTELVAVMTGQSTVAKTYEEVSQDQKASQVKSAILGAVTSHELIQANDKPTRWNRAAWKINFEVPSETISKAAASDPEFAGKVSKFMSSDVMLDLGAVRDAANSNFFDITVGEDNTLKITLKPNYLELKGVTVDQAGLEAANIFTQDTSNKDLNNFLTANKTKIEDINYKLSVMSTLGDLGNSTKQVLFAELGIAPADSKAKSTTAYLLDKFEGGGDYNTLFGFANREGGPFADTKVSEMTIGQLKDFADNKYADYSRKQLGYKATPMGRYQFVGTTLADVAKRMGLADDTVFSPAVQDKMFIFHAKEVIADKAPAGQRAALRGTWEGLKNASDAELDTMIAEIQSGKASFATSGATQGTRFQGANPSTPNANPPAQTAPAQAQGAAPVAMSTPTQVSTTTPTANATQTASVALPDQVQTPQGNEPKTAGNTPIDPAILDTISALAQNANDVRVFTTTEEMKQAYTNQEVNVGSLVVINGKLMSVTKDMVK